MAKTTPRDSVDAGALLSELRASQAAVAGDVAVLQANLVSLDEIAGTLTVTLEEAKKAQAAVAAEKLAALTTIQGRLEMALAIIRAEVSKVTATDPFTEPRRLGGVPE